MVGARSSVPFFINTLTLYIAPLTYPLSSNGGEGQVEGEVIFTE